jgi:hypothetical protein
LFNNSGSTGGSANLTFNLNQNLFSVGTNTVFANVTSGLVGIGTASPTVKLHVETNSAVETDIARFRVLNGANGVFLDIGGDEPNRLITFDATGVAACAYVYRSGGAERMRLTSAGDLGIGTSSPSAKLHVVNSTPNSGKQALFLDSNYGNTGDSAASIRATLNNNAGGTYIWGYTSESILAHNTEFISGSNWVARSTTASYLSQSGGIFTFFSNQSLTAGNTFTPSERMRLDTSGNLGIGSTAPAEALEISRTTDPKIRFVDVGNLDAKIGIVSSTALGFEVNGSERMRIASDGKVGIASTNPGVDLQIGSDTSTTRALSVRYSSVPLYLSGGFDGTNALNTFSANAYANATGSGQSWTSFSNTSYAASAVQLASSTTGADIRFLTAAAANTNPTERARITSGGDLLVGTTNTSATAGEGFKSVFPIAAVPSVRSVGNNSTSSYSTYEVYSTSAAAYRFYVDYAGTVFATTTTISAISDQRFKENVQDIDVGLNAVMALKPRKFDWKAGKGKDIKNDRGFIAQEFEQVFPDLIDEWKDPAPEGEEPYKSVRQDLIPVLVKAIQELTARVAQLESK